MPESKITGSQSQIGSDVKARIAYIDKQCGEIEGLSWEQKKINTKIFQQFYLGNQWASYKHGKGGWSVDPTLVPKRYDSAGREVWNFTGDDNIPDEFPRRTINMTFPIVETERGLFNNLRPVTHVLSPTAEPDEKYQDVIIKLNALLDFFFHEKERLNNILYGKIIVDGDAPLVIIRKNRGEGKPPFDFVIEKSDRVWANPEIDDWSDIDWVIRKISMKGMDIKKQYGAKIKGFLGNPKDYKDYENYELKEYWMKESNGRWTRVVMNDTGFVLQYNSDDQMDTKSFPVLPIEVFRMYVPPKGWYGISEIDNMFESQLIINKRASQEDYKNALDLFPPMAIPAESLYSILGNGVKSGKSILPPGFLCALGAMGERPAPLIADTANPSFYQMSIAQANAAMESTSGIQRGMQGNNEKGVYSGSHFQAIRDAAMGRIDNKLFWIKQSFENLSRKFLAWCYEDLHTSNQTYRLYSGEIDDFVDITADDILLLDRLEFDTETEDASVFSPLERLNQIQAIAQYNPTIAGSDIVIASNKAMPGLFDKQTIVNQIEINKLNQQLNVLALKAQIAQAQQAINPPQQTPSATSAMPVDQQQTPVGQSPDMAIPQQQVMPPVEQTMLGQPQPESIPVDEQWIRQFVEGEKINMMNAGIPEDETNAMIQTAVEGIMNNNPNISQDDFKNEFYSAITEIQNSKEGVQ